VKNTTSAILLIKGCNCFSVYNGIQHGKINVMMLVMFSVVGVAAATTSVHGKGSHDVNDAADGCVLSSK
jgi:hypothetical protein